MNDSDHNPANSGSDAGPVPLRRRRVGQISLNLVLVCAAIALGVFVGVVLTRERLANDLIDSTLREYGVPATYDIAAIGPREQVIENIVIGDPGSPDLTIDRAVMTVDYRFGTPTIGMVRLERPRLYARWRQGRVSFGSLDPLVYESKSDKPFALPDVDLAIVDGRALFRSPWGNVGAKLKGKGNLSGGFSGVAGAVMPVLAAGECEGRDGTAYGEVKTRQGRLEFEGPLRLASMQCGQFGRVGPSALQIRAETGDFAGFEMVGRLNSANPAQGDARAKAIEGDLALTRHASDGSLVSNFDLALRGIDGMGVKAGSLRLEGRIRARHDFSYLAFNGGVEAAGIQPARAVDSRLIGWSDAAAGTLARPLLQKLRRNLMAQGRNSALSVELQARFSDGRTTLVVPQAHWRSPAGQTLLSVSRGQLALGAGRTAQIAGNFTTSGPGMPNIVGEMDKDERGVTRVRLAMAEYSADNASIEVPELRLAQTTSGAFALSGRVKASGAFPGGTVVGLDLPLNGGWSVGKGLALGTRCIAPRFEAMTLASLHMTRQSILLCPPSGGAILRSGAGGTRFAAGVPAIDLGGRIGETRVQLNGGPVGLAVPGVLVARDLHVELGEGGTATRFALANLTAELGTEIRGRFADLEMRMAAVPLDVTQASGNWAYEDSALVLNDARIRVTDRADAPRFNPMIAEGAALTLANNRITADALLREEKSGRAVADVDIVHDLGAGSGHADLGVQRLTFDNGLQPTDLTPLAFGVVANTQGTVSGAGRIAWNASKITSTGTFSTESLDFAAAFGPVKGLAGTIRFTDLLGMVTAPDQQITVAEVNPGIAVENGVIRYALEPNNVFAFHSGKWPFVGGTLELKPVRMTLGVEETRRYTFVINGLDAARFLERMEMANLSATGTFDGTLPVVFDGSGGRIEGGYLRARAPGGNLSYVGALSYEDMSPITNFAFDALKSLDYQDMSIGMDGALEGEIVTRVRIDGVSQGEAASKNILTRKLASLPIRFNVNIRAPFYQLLSSLKSLYDPASVRDPRELGLLRQEDGALVPEPGAPMRPQTPVTAPENLSPAVSAIHIAESETMQ